MKKIVFSILGAFLLALLQSCTSGIELASNYVDSFSSEKKAPNQKLYVCLPQTLIHTNSTATETPGFNSLSPESQDFLIQQNSEFLNKINDSIILSQFNEHFLYNLSLLGMPLYVVNDPQELPFPDSNSIFTIHVVQVEAQEFTIPRRIEYEEESEREYFLETVDLKGFSLNGWFLYNEKDTNQAKLFYKNFEIVENISASIDPKDNKEQARLSYKVKKMNFNDIYYTAYGLGKLSGTLFVEKFINEQVNAKKKDNESYYFFDTKNAKVNDYRDKSYVKESYYLQELPLKK